MPKVNRRFQVGDFIYLTSKAPSWLIAGIGDTVRGEIINVKGRILSIRFPGAEEPLLVNNTNWLRKG